MTIPGNVEPHIMFDLDGTLAYYDHWRGVAHIGKPIEAMARRLVAHIQNGDKVKIFTARASDGDGGIKATYFIRAWLKLYGLPELGITCIKDHGCRYIYDDRCVQVEKNTGELIGRVEDWWTK